MQFHGFRSRRMKACIGTHHHGAGYGGIETHRGRTAINMIARAMCQDTRVRVVGVIGFLVLLIDIDECVSLASEGVTIEGLDGEGGELRAEHRTKEKDDDQDTHESRTRNHDPLPVRLR